MSCPEIELSWKAAMYLLGAGQVAWIAHLAGLAAGLGLGEIARRTPAAAWRTP